MTEIRIKLKKVHSKTMNAIPVGVLAASAGGTFTMGSVKGLEYTGHVMEKGGEKYIIAVSRNKHRAKRVGTFVTDPVTGRRYRKTRIEKYWDVCYTYIPLGLFQYMSPRTYRFTQQTNHWTITRI